MNTKAVIYARVSSKEQEEGGYSLDAQLDLLRTYASENNIQVTHEYIEVESAKQAGRHEFKEMLRFIKSEIKSGKKNPCKMILVEKTDRLYRNIPDYATIDDLKINLNFVKENIIYNENSHSSQKFMHGIKVLMAKNFIDNLSEETRKGMMKKAEQGIYPTKAPYGYDNVKKGKISVIEPNIEQSKIVMTLFKTYSTGNYSIKSIAAKLNDMGFRYSKSTPKFPKSSVARWLSNPIYYGSFIFHKKLIPGIHKPIISKELFDRVQNVLDEKRNGAKTTRKHKWRYQGLVRCGYSGYLLSAEEKKKHIYYHCSKCKENCEHREYIKQPTLDSYFEKYIASINVNDAVRENILQALKESYSIEKECVDVALNGLQKKYLVIKNRLDKLYEDKLDGFISTNFYTEKQSSWSFQLDKIHSTIKGYEVADNAYKKLGIKLLELCESLLERYLTAKDVEKRKTLQFLFSNAIWKDKKLQVKFRKPFDFLILKNPNFKSRNTQNSGNLTYGVDDGI
jgi:site-specific DNA recombinase